MNMKFKNLLLTWGIVFPCLLTTLSLQAQSISGAVHTADGSAMENITIKVNEELALTGLDGAYLFLNLTSASNYVVTPSKEEENPMNGVNAFDLIVMRKHILGIAPFESAYQKIAADVNGSGTITSFDIVKLRRLILQIDEDFGDLNAWRFVDANFEMDSANLAQVPNFPEERALDALVAGLSSIDFIGVKLGDVNFSASANLGHKEVEERSNETLYFIVEEEIEETYTTLNFRAKDFKDITAFQFTLNFSANDYAFMGVKAVDLSEFNEENIGLKFQENGQLTFVWQDVQAVSLNDQSVLFQLKFEHKQANQQASTIHISSDKTPALAFKSNGEAWTIANQQVQMPNVTDALQLDNYPNPFHEQTTVRFSMVEDGEAILRVLSSTGAILKTINGNYSKGYHEVILKRENFNINNSLLFLQLQIENKTIMKKIMFN